MKDNCVRVEKSRQLFYSQLEKMFAGKELQNFKGKSGFSNLLTIKAKYFKAIQDELEREISTKYFELESYEETLAKAEYALNDEEIIDLYNSRKLITQNTLDKSDGIKFNYRDIYDDIDIYETISNLSGWKIKQRFEDRCVFLDGNNEIEVKEDELYFSEYPFLRDLIWWKV